MSDPEWMNALDGRVVAVGIPIATTLIWYLLRRRRLIDRAARNYPYILAAIEIGLALAIGWSLGSIAEFVRNTFVPEKVQDQPLLLLKLAMYLAVSFSIARLVEAHFDSFGQRGSGPELTRLSRLFVYSACLFIGVIVFLAANDFTKLTVVAGGLAAVFAFGLRQTLTDIVSGVALAIERPFRRRDWIMLEDGTAAEVIDLDWRATHLRGWDRMIALVPNSQLTRQSFRVLPKSGELYADTLVVLVGAEEGPERVKLLLEQAAKQCDGVMRRPPPVVRLADASTIPYRYSLWVHFDGYMAAFAGREELYSNIHRIFGEAGIRVTAPVQDVRYSSLPPTIAARGMGQEYQVSLTDQVPADAVD